MSYRASGRTGQDGRGQSSHDKVLQLHFVGVNSDVDREAKGIAVISESKVMAHNEIDGKQRRVVSTYLYLVMATHWHSYPQPSLNHPLCLPEPGLVDARHEMGYYTPEK